ncbi:hypothetical protein BU16DRAFT_558157 [Lophium mytilinum]|uniref:RING-type domain-containing protein n=1 Tax=Lophium mytilinum TaxID=390894 RepID=A0A6A6R7P0_9PEZI|nr:hypothetical protein BU16DRAFT_558157 [Lophium mytilinum]
MATEMNSLGHHSSNSACLLLYTAHALTQNALHRGYLDDRSIMTFATALGELLVVTNEDSITIRVPQGATVKSRNGDEPALPLQEARDFIVTGSEHIAFLSQDSQYTALGSAYIRGVGSRVRLVAMQSPAAVVVECGAERLLARASGTRQITIRQDSSGEDGGLPAPQQQIIQEMLERIIREEVERSVNLRAGYSEAVSRRIRRQAYLETLRQLPNNAEQNAHQIVESMRHTDIRYSRAIENGMAANDHRLTIATIRHTLAEQRVATLEAERQMTMDRIRARAALAAMFQGGNRTQVDMQTFTSSLGACPICLEEYSSTHEPIILDKCRHIFGSECLQNHVNESALGQRHLCPTCRTVMFEG